ncbi:MAG: family 78 glycoside hydrolase catalytic domain [Petrimonas sp.]|jgi:alpha-L-rhamnosidase
MKFIKKVETLIFSLVLLSIFGCSQSNISKITDLKCENLCDPLGVNTLQPRFSWKNSSIEEGTNQSAYQILIAGDIKNLNEDKADFWNSGKVASSSNILIDYQGKEIDSRQLLYWKVRTWDENDKVSKWSDVGVFSVGILDESDWTASYIGYPSENEVQSSPQFRKVFSIEKPNKDESFLLHVNSLGYHEVFINGEKVSEDVLSPAVSQFNKRSLIKTYDVTSYVTKGENNLILWLGSGWYSKGLPGVISEGPLVKAQLEKVSGKISENIVVTNDTWTARDSEYIRIGNWKWNSFGGEEVSGNLETQNIVFTNPDDLKWDKVSVVDVPKHAVTPQMVEPNRIKKEIKPTKIDKLNDSTFLVDMGTTLTGWFEITFPQLKEGQKVVMEYSDHLDDNGQIVNQGQIDRYIASGKGTEFFKNKFNYHGFRYVKISNLNDAPDLASMKAHQIHTDFELISGFECSDSDLNRIHDMVQYTLQCLGLGGYLVDCPQIERLGYGGDGNASTVTAQTMFNLAPLYNNWLDAWQDVIREDGSMPHTAPNPYAAGGGPYWCGFIISASWNTYQNYGDIKVLEKYYPIMQKWLGYVDNHSVNGLLKRWPDTDYRNWYLGDWATPDGVGNPNHLEEKSVDLVNNSYLSVCYSQMANIADVLGKENDKKQYLEKKNRLNKIINDTFFDATTGLYGTGSQIDLIFPMLADVIPQDEQESITKLLIEKTATEDKGHLNTGLVGIPVMMEWAAKNNQPEFIYSMLKKKTYPGYLHMLENGATTTWEHWNGARSRIHNCFNGVGQWFYQSVGGIRQIAGKAAYSEFLVDPQIPSGVTWAKTHIDTPKGLVLVHWEILDNQMKMNIEVPVGSIAKVNYPKNSSVKINNQLYQFSSDLIELQSGKYVVEYELKSNNHE